jgi:hypothetical protein
VIPLIIKSRGGKGMKKWIRIFMVLFLCFVSVPHMTEAKGFSHSSTHFGSTYHSGYRSPSTRLRTPGSTYNRGTSTFGRSIMTHAAAFGAGALIGHMFHPFGGFYNGGYGGFSMFGFLLDILIIVAIVWFIRKIFAGRH